MKAFWKWGSLGESKMWKIKRGSFSDRRFENGGQCGRTYPSHIFRECPPPIEANRLEWTLWKVHFCPRFFVPISREKAIYKTLRDHWVQCTFKIWRGEFPGSMRLLIITHNPQRFIIVHAIPQLSVFRDLCRNATGKSL